MFCHTHQSIFTKLSLLAKFCCTLFSSLPHILWLPDIKICSKAYIHLVVNNWWFFSFSVTLKNSDVLLFRISISLLKVQLNCLFYYSQPSPFPNYLIVMLPKPSLSWEPSVTFTSVVICWGFLLVVVVFCLRGDILSPSWC